MGKIIKALQDMGMPYTLNLKGEPVYQGHIVKSVHHVGALLFSSTKVG